MDRRDFFGGKVGGQGLGALAGSLDTDPGYNQRKAERRARGRGGRGQQGAAAEAIARTAEVVPASDRADGAIVPPVDQDPFARIGDVEGLAGTDPSLFGEDEVEEPGPQGGPQ